MSHFRDDLYAPEDELQADPVDEKPVKRRGRVLAVCLLLALLGSGSAYLWRSYESIAEPGVPKTDEISQLTGALRGLQQSQQGMAADVRRNQEMLQAQQARIERLSDEIAQLTAKLDLSQSSAREAEASTAHKPPPKKPASKPIVHQPASQPLVSPTPEEKQ